ncbi:E3 ubiquitin-protein ligase RNF181 [Heracleum sosnowskyi]|uniref:E3 ubiquitin-protein ligase RNF181 n=1 Tax=Heracleum sosnowskyi TaxID=360622 RepID=A0AAD8I949_9APIA|nr:E3 ubiquitin-protein ligase RNF181 [Heracleum sosnowskyi]
MGLSNFHGPNDGVLPLLVMNTVLSVALLKNMLRSVLDQVVGADTYDTEDEETYTEPSRRVFTSKYGEMKWEKRVKMEECCCVCLCRFKEDEEVSELCYCQHLFHKGCLEKWFENQHTTCPLCRSVL